MSSNNGGYKALCPACGERMRIQSGASESLLSKPIYAQCQNLWCSATYQGVLSWDAVINPSAIAEVPLPTSDERRGRNTARPKRGGQPEG